MSGVAFALAFATVSCGDDPNEPDLKTEPVAAAKSLPADSTADSVAVILPAMVEVQRPGGVVSSVCMRQQKELRVVAAAQARDPENADLAAKRGELSAVVDDICN
jgi:hypothetical protein